MANARGVGLDIGTSAVKVVELKKGPSGLELLHQASLPLPAGAIQNGVIAQAPEVTDTIKRVLKLAHISTKEVYVAVAGQSVVVRQIRLPIMSEAEVREAIPWEAEKHLPYSPDQAVIDFHIIGPAADNEGEMEVMLVAAQNDLVYSHVSVLEEAGLEPVAMDVQPFALLRSLGLEQERSDRCCGIIDIGAGTTDVVIFRGDSLKFTRIIPVAGQRFTQVVAEGLQCSFIQADEIKAREGRVFFGNEPELADPNSIPARVFQIVRPVLEELLLEIRRSVDYFKLQNRGDGVDELVLTGGGSKLSGLDRLLSNELGIPTRVGDPLDGVHYNHRSFDPASLQGIGPMLAVSFGLAQRGVEEA